MIEQAVKGIVELNFAEEELQWSLQASTDIIFNDLDERANEPVVAFGSLSHAISAFEMSNLVCDGPDSGHAA